MEGPTIQFEKERLAPSTVLSFKETERSTPSWKAALYHTLEKWMDDSPTFSVQTSGSTGEPKTIELPKSGMQESARRTCDHFGLQQGDTVWLCLSADRIAGVMMVVRAFERGLNLLITPPSGQPLPDLPVTPADVDLVSMVPYQLQQSLQKDGPEALEEIGHILLGGAPVPSPLEKSIQGLHVPVHEGYGMTETASHIALRQINTQPYDRIFKAFKGIWLFEGEAGNLKLQVPYISNEQIATDDLVAFEGLREFRWLGRRSNVINSGGIKVIPETVEEKLAGMIDRRFFLTGLPDEALGECVTIVLEGEPFDRTTEKLFNNCLGSYLEGAERPRKIRFVERFAETPTGKIDRINTREWIKIGRQ